MRRVESDYEILKEYIRAEDKTIIDVGCGTGDLVRWLASQEIKVVGIDVEEMIEKAKAFPKAKNEQYIVGGGEHLSFDDNYANTIIFIASFHHVPSTQMVQALKECYRVLKPDGRVILVEPLAEKDSYYEIIKLAEDEAEIQNHAYGIIKESDKAGLKFLSEEIFYLERSFQDYINLLNVFIPSESEKKSMIEKARKTTLKLCEKSGDTLEEFLYKSIARFIVLEK